MAKPWGHIPKNCRGKRQLKGKRFSTTKGKDKGIRPRPDERTIAKRARSYLWPEYSQWATKFNGGKVRK